MKYPEKMEKLFQDESFKQAATMITTAEEMQHLLSSKGVDYTLDDVNEMCEEIALAMKSNRTGEDELREDDLEQVTGGSVTALAVGVCIGLGIVAIGVFAVGVYIGYQRAKRANEVNA